MLLPSAPWSWPPVPVPVPGSACPLAALSPAGWRLTGDVALLRRWSSPSPSGFPSPRRPAGQSRRVSSLSLILFTLIFLLAAVTHDLSASKSIYLMCLNQIWLERWLSLLQRASSFQETNQRCLDLAAAVRFTHLHHISRQTLEVRRLTSSVNQDFSWQAGGVFSGRQNVQKPAGKNTSGFENGNPGKRKFSIRAKAAKCFFLKAMSFPCGIQDKGRVVWKMEQPEEEGMFPLR